MRIIKTKKFSKWAIKSKIPDISLVEAAKEIELDIYEANYGGGVLKKRVFNKGRGKKAVVPVLLLLSKRAITVILYLGLKRATKIIFQQVKKRHLN